MLSVDIIGIVITICLVGLRYPHYVFLAAIIHDVGRVLMTLFLHGSIQSIISAGAFGTTMAAGIKSGSPVYLIMFSGAIANYIVSATAGGIEFEKTRHIVNPFLAVKHPFAVVNLRLAILSLLVNLWLIF